MNGKPIRDAIFLNIRMRNPTNMTIESIVCDYYKVALCEVQKRDRHGKLTLPRHMIAFQYKKFTKVKNPAIANLCGIDRTSVYYAVKSRMISQLE